MIKPDDVGTIISPALRFQANTQSAVEVAFRNAWPDRRYTPPATRKPVSCLALASDPARNSASDWNAFSR